MWQFLGQRQEEGKNLCLRCNLEVGGRPHPKRLQIGLDHKAALEARVDPLTLVELDAIITDIQQGNRGSDYLLNPPSPTRDGEVSLTSDILHWLQHTFVVRWTAGCAPTATTAQKEQIQEYNERKGQAQSTVRCLSSPIKNL